MPKKDIITEIEGRKLKLSNLDKILYPELGIVKAELIEYYLKIAPFILPHLYNRPLTLIRYPDGIQGKRFYSKNRPNWTPEWIDSVKLEKEDDNTYVLANDTPSLIWIANLAALEIHPMQITADKVDCPDHFIFDLDPPETADFDVVKRLALRLKPFLESHGYKPFLKTSGSKGLHIYVPIIPIYKQETVLKCAKDLAKQYIKMDKGTTLKMNKEKRKGKVLLDIYRNHKSQTCVAAYSTRGKKGAPISAPIYWHELEGIDSSQVYSIRTIFQRLKEDGDPWKDFMEQRTKLHTDNSPSGIPVLEAPSKILSTGTNATIDQIDLKPMLASLGKKIPSKKDYIFEIKWDGIRVIIKKESDKVSIISRNGNDLTDKFPIIEELIKGQIIESFIADGELIVKNQDGTPNFSKIVGRMHTKRTSIRKTSSSNNRASLYLFDFLYADGQDYRDLAVEKRRNLLLTKIQWNEFIKFSDSFEDGKQLFSAIKLQNMEGIMCKKKGSSYQSNTRSSSWVKIKVQNEDIAMIIGYTKGKGDRSQLFGALHLAKKKKDNYIYLGKVGTGFNTSKMKEIKKLLTSVDITKKPFRDNIEEEKNSIWIEPVYSCEIKFATLTSNGTYREPVFLNIHKSSEKH